MMNVKKGFKMPELYKGQYNKFKQTSEALANDPLGEIKNALLDEEEKYNCMDENHTPLMFFAQNTPAEQLGFCNIFGGITLRKSDNHIAMYFRYMYPDGEKNG